MRTINNNQFQSHLNALEGIKFLKGLKVLKALKVFKIIELCLKN